MAKTVVSSKLIIWCMILFFSCSKKLEEIYQPPKELGSHENKTLYTLGRIIGKSIKKFQLSNEETQIFFKGIIDEQNSIPADFSLTKYELKLNEFLEFKKANKIAKNIVHAEKKMDELKQMQLIEELPGFLLKIQTQGKPIDTHYKKVLLSSKLMDMDGKILEELNQKEIHISSLPKGIQLTIHKVGFGGSAISAFNHEFGFGLEGSGNIEGGQGLRLELTVHEQKN